jgi:hypothetical protein
MLHNVNFIFHIMTSFSQLYLYLSNHTEMLIDRCTNILTSCTRPSSEAPLSQRISCVCVCVCVEMTRKICQINVTGNSLLYWSHTTYCSSEHTHLQTAHCLDTSADVMWITLSLYLSLITHCQIFKVRPESPDCRVTADWQKCTAPHILAITVSKRKAKAVIAEWA